MTLRTRLLLIALAAIAPAVITIIYLQVSDVAQIRRRAHEQTTSLAHQLASGPAAALGGGQRFLATASQVPALAGHDLDACQAALDGMLRTHTDYLALRVIDADGSRVCESGQSAVVSNELRFDLSAASPFRLGAYHVNAQGDVQADVARRVGDSRRTLVATIVVARGASLRDRIHAPPDTTFTVFDRKGVILAAFPQKSSGLLPGAVTAQRVAAAAARDRVLDVVGPNGVRRFEVTVPVNGAIDTGLYATVGINVAVAAAEATGRLRGNLLVLVLVSFAAIVVALVGGELVVSRPLKGVADVVRRIAHGDFRARADLECAIPGVSDAVSAVNAMAAALEERARERDAAEDRSAQLFNASPHPMWLLDETFRFLAVNQAAIDKYGYTRDEFLKLRLHDLHGPEDAAAIDARVSATEECYDGVWRHYTKDGRILDVAVHRTFVQWGGITARLVLAQDITTQKAMEEQLRQSQRMDAIGQLAGGVAHDFNNTLTAIQGFALLAEDNMANGRLDRESVREIIRAADRAADLTRQLLAFSRHQVLEPRVVRLSDIAREAMPMLRRLIGAGIEIETSFEDHEYVKADPGSLQQVLMNLVVNARDAMPGGGRLSVRIADVTIDQRGTGSQNEVPPGRFVRMSVADTGHGMDAAVQARVFEPFFSTKPKGQGTGLGLATVYGIVRQSGGWIDLASVVSAGTTFHVYLPCTDDVAEQPVSTPERSHTLSRSETILVVEDETAVRTYIERVLRAHGHVVHAVGDPASAIAFAEAHEDPIDLVLSDIVLPEMNGPAMVGDALALHPEARVVYMSGYTEDTMSKWGWYDGSAPFVQKPFTPDTLLRVVHAALDAHPASKSAVTDYSSDSPVSSSSGAFVARFSKSVESPSSRSSTS
jgi:PAS domain S-box-containing protein